MRLYTSELVKKYKSRTVVNHVSIDVNQGEIVGLLGPNGAGKTTTFYMIVGLVKPNDGRIFVEENGSGSAASIIAAETGVSLSTLSMAMSGDDYFEAMYANIDALKEALK